MSTSRNFLPDETSWKVAPSSSWWPEWATFQCLQIPVALMRRPNLESQSEWQQRKMLSGDGNQRFFPPFFGLFTPVFFGWPSPCWLVETLTCGMACSSVLWPLSGLKVAILVLPAASLSEASTDVGSLVMLTASDCCLRWKPVLLEGRRSSSTPGAYIGITSKLAVKGTEAWDCFFLIPSSWIAKKNWGWNIFKLRSKINQDTLTVFYHTRRVSAKKINNEENVSREFCCIPYGRYAERYKYEPSSANFRPKPKGFQILGHPSIWDRMSKIHLTLYLLSV